jgi:hypothetical protein
MAQTDAATALRKLQSNQPLTDAEKKILGMSVTPENTGVFPITGPTWQQIADEKDAAEAQRIADEAAAEAQRLADITDNKGDDLTPEELAARQAAAVEEARKLNEKRDAFAAIRTTIQDYGFTDEEYAELSKYVEGALINPKIGPNQMILELRALPTYKARFSGNDTRLKNGLNALSEANYIQQENSYAEYLAAGGVSKLGTRSTYAKLIGGAVAPIEVGKRVNMAVDRVQNADPDIMRMIRMYNPTISQQDLVSYFLDPENTLPELQKKVAMGEIGAAASQAGLDYNFGRIEDLQKYGVDQKTAREGYSTIAGILPTTEKLGGIYNETGIRYAQTEGEAEVFKGNQDVATKRKRLFSLERAAFGGSSGTGQSALSTGSTKSSSTAGLI